MNRPAILTQPVAHAPSQQNLALFLIYVAYRSLLALVLLILAILDYIWNRYKHVQDLRMTKEEVKEEMRRMEGDPVVKQRRRRVQMHR